MPVILFRGLLGSDDSLSVIRDNEAFRLIGAQSDIQKVFLREDTFDSALLGHSQLDIPQGPLTVAALGWDPPERSTHFHLSLLSLSDTTISVVRDTPNRDELEEIKAEMRRLNTKALTLLFGEGVDHALVWERRVDLLARRPIEAAELGLKAALPEGDLESDLRRLIDDSINILGEREFNVRRIDAGKQPLNLLWPWGHGERRTVNNIALRLGYPWRIFSESLSLRGYAKLSGLRNEKLASLRSLSGPKVDGLVRTLKQDGRVLVDIDFSSFAMEEDIEEKAYVASEIAQGLVMPMMDWQKESGGPIVFVATNAAGNGVMATARQRPSDRDLYPFDERVLDERKAPELPLTNLLAYATAL